MPMEASGSLSIGRSDFSLAGNRPALNKLLNQASSALQRVTDYSILFRKSKPNRAGPICLDATFG